MKLANIGMNILGILISSLGFGYAVQHNQTVFIFVHGGLIAFNAFLLQRNLELNK